MTRKRSLSKAEMFTESLERPNDPLLTAVKVKNRSDGILEFKSTLESFSDLEEVKAWKVWTLAVNEEKVIPHHYWTVSRVDGGAQCEYQVSHAPKGESDFIYKKKARGLSV